MNRPDRRPTVAADDHVVVIGTGQAGFQLAASLREAGFAGPVTLLGEEPGLPYQRPPLSKTYLHGEPERDSVLLRGRAFYDKRDLTVRDGTRVEHVDRERSAAVLPGGERLRYDHLVLATGARARRITVPGAGLDGVAALRTIDDAEILRDRLRDRREVVVVGGGFIGMEFAAVAVTAGHRVTVVESSDRPMARVVSPEVSAHVTRVHEQHGVRFMLGETVPEIHGSDGRVGSVELGGGEKLDADLVLVGVGAVPNAGLAHRAGLEICPVTGGIVVDDRLGISDARISAIGDCATYPSVHAPAPVRLESVQNAVDHARHLAARLVHGADTGYRSVPWFWTDQFDLRIQIAGLGGRDDARSVLGDPAAGRFSVLRFHERRLVAVESVNRAPDHIAARHVLAGERRPTPAVASAPGFDLKTWLAAG